MRLLYVDINGQFLNPTRNLLPVALKLAGETRFYGPGYTAAAELQRGLLAFIATHGPFDLVLTNTHFLYCDIYGLDKNPTAYRSFYDIPCSDDDLSTIPRSLKELSELDNVCGLLFENDLYHATQRELDALDRRVRHIVGLGENFFLPEGEIMAAGGEHFSGQITPYWSQFIRSHRHRIANLPAFVDAHEFCRSPLHNRPRTWDVPGIGYRARRAAVAKLVSGGYRSSRRLLLPRIEALARRVGLMKRASRLRQSIANKGFQIQLEQARFVFTCGSQIRLPIRKFFEIPAAGAVMVCEPFAGFGEAGFVDGKHAVIASPEDLLDVDADLSADPERAQAIATSGQDLVWSSHSTHARATQFRETFAAMIDGRFTGAGWQAGRYVVHLSEELTGAEP